MTTTDLLRKRLGLEQALVEIEKECSDLDQLILESLGKRAPKEITKTPNKIIEKKKTKGTKKGKRAAPGSNEQAIMACYKKRKQWSIIDLTKEIHGNVKYADKKYYKRIYVVAIALAKKGSLKKVDRGVYRLVEK
jgi:hypothetical protein